MIPDPADVVGRRIDELLAQEGLGQLVAEYFAWDLTRENSTFAGSSFDTWENPEAAADHFTTADLFALTFLDERVPGVAARQLLEEKVADRALADVDDVDLWTATPEQRAEAEELWMVLKGVKWLGRTRVSKLCSRKRPHLIPIRDSVVERVLALPSSDSWVAIGGALTTRHEAVAKLRPAKLGYEPSTLRLLDVAAWMVGSNSKPARAARNSIRPAEPAPWM